MLHLHGMASRRLASEGFLASIAIPTTDLVSWCCCRGPLRGIWSQFSVENRLNPPDRVLKLDVAVVLLFVVASLFPLFRISRAFSMLHVIRVIVMLSIVFAIGSESGAIEIDNVMQFSIDQPRIYTLLQRPGEPGPLVDGSGYFTFDAYLDTGSSGVIMSHEVGVFLNVNRQQIDGQNVVFANSGATGNASFEVSERLNIGMAPFTPTTPLDGLDTFEEDYTHWMRNVRIQLEDTFASNPVNVIGMPGLVDKVTVIDPKPADDFTHTMNSYIYDPGTPFNPATQSSDPGIPETTHHVRLSYADFTQFTNLSPPQAEAPVLARNPFIGPNPLLQLDPDAPADDTPPVQFSLGDRTTEGSLLFDTGAAVSFMSRDLASDLNVRYRPGTFGSATPILESFDPNNPAQPGTLIADQFRLDVGGVVGNVTFSGFYLDTLTVKTDEGDAMNPNDSNHINYMGAPILVNDIQLRDPESGAIVTLDGVFGMNYLAASGDIGEENGFPTLVNEAPGNFDWVVYDDVNGRLGLVPNESSTSPRCDFDNDGKCDIADLDLLMYTGLGTNNSTFDLDGSGLVDLADRDEFLIDIGSLPGDATLDGVDNATDLNRIGSNWQGSVSSWGDGDFNGDGLADAKDLNELGIWWTKTGADFAASQPAASAAVPEPSGISIVLVAGLLGLSCRRID